jgi:hypothetical protein
MSEAVPKTSGSPLSAVVRDELCGYYQHLAAQVERAVRSLPREAFWVKPLPYGNSIGHLVLHLTGNLNHFVGARIAGTDYVRDRPGEFNDQAELPAELVLARFREALALVVRTIQELDDDSLMVPVAEPQPSRTQFGVLLVCAAHLNNHLGQMSYLVQAQGHSTQDPPAW